MSDIDLTEAVDAAAAGVLNRQVVSDKGQPLSARAYAHAAVTAALPHIARQVREQVAREIEAECSQVLTDDGSGRIESAALTHAARIARGDHS